MTGLGDLKPSGVQEDGQVRPEVPACPDQLCPRQGRHGVIRHHESKTLGSGRKGLQGVRAPGAGHDVIASPREHGVAETQEGLVIIDQQDLSLLDLHRPLLTRLRVPRSLQTLPAPGMHTLRIHFRAARSLRENEGFPEEKRKWDVSRLHHRLPRGQAGAVHLTDDLSNH